MAIYLALDVTDRMFRGTWECMALRKVLNLEGAGMLISQGVTLCFDPSNDEGVVEKTLTQYGIDLRDFPVWDQPVSLDNDDLLLLLNVEYLMWVAENRSLGEDPPLDCAFALWRMVGV